MRLTAPNLCARYCVPVCPLLCARYWLTAVPVPVYALQAAGKLFIKLSSAHRIIVMMAMDRAQAGAEVSTRAYSADAAGTSELGIRSRTRRWTPVHAEIT